MSSELVACALHDTQRGDHEQIDQVDHQAHAQLALDLHGHDHSENQKVNDVNTQQQTEHRLRVKRTCSLWM